MHSDDPTRILPGPARPAERRAVAAWVVYDLANTLFSANIISNYFALWVVRDMGGSDAMLSIAIAISAALMIVLGPVLGTVSDRASRRMPFLVVTTIACCVFTALMGESLPISLILFVLANLAFQIGLVFYDALLAVVSTPETRGRIGGLGVGIGYLGSVLGLGVGASILALGGTDALVFRATALLFFVLAIPCFLWVREPASTPAPHPQRPLGAVVTELATTLKNLRGEPNLARFLASRALYADAANTLTAFMAIYAVSELGFPEAQKDLLLLLGIAAAVIGGLAWGRVVDRIGPQPALMRVLGVWMIVLSVTAMIGIVHLPREVFWAVAPLAGFALGATWTSDRPLLLALAAPDKLGEITGLYAITGRFAAIIGLLGWALIVDGLGWGRPIAVGALLLMVIAAAVVLKPVQTSTS